MSPNQVSSQLSRNHIRDSDTKFIIAPISVYLTVHLSTIETSEKPSAVCGRSMGEVVESIAMEMRCLADSFLRAIVGVVERHQAEASAGDSVDASNTARDAALWELGGRTICSWADSVDEAVLVDFLRVSNHRQCLTSTCSELSGGELLVADRVT